MAHQTGNKGVLKSALMALLRFIFEGRGDDPLSLLRVYYQKEMLLTARLKAHAGDMPYPAFRDGLEDMSRLCHEAAGQLGIRIQAMGSGLPDIPQPELTNGTLWEKLAADVNELNSLYYSYLTLAGVDEDLDKLMTGLKADKNRQATTIQRLLSGLDCYSI